MSISINKARNKFFISYKAKLPNGEFHTFNITNKDWKLQESKKLNKNLKIYLQSIEQDEIEKDLRKRKLYMHSGDNITLLECFEMYKTHVYVAFGNQTAYAKDRALLKYLVNFLPNKELDQVFNIVNIEKIKTFILSHDLCSKRTNTIFSILREFMTFASDRDFMSYDLNKKLARLLTPVSSHEEIEEDLKFWTFQEWERFCTSFDDDDPWKILFEVFMMTALRIGELIGLKWRALNAENCKLYVGTSLMNNGKPSNTKTISSKGTVDIPEWLVERLLWLKEVTYGTDDDYIFFAPNKLSKKAVRKVMKKHIEMSGVPFIVAHGLRHTCATIMLLDGAPIEDVSKHLRHKSIKITYDTYIHLLPSSTTNAVKKVFGNKMLVKKTENGVTI